MTIGVLVMAYGTPARREDVLEYYRDIRLGNPPSAEQLGALLARYDAIGGLSPLNARSAAQVAMLQACLDELEPGVYLSAYGTKHAKPSIEEAIEELVGKGAQQVVGLVLAPHYSSLSVGQYLARAANALQQHGRQGAFLQRWGDDPTLIELLAERVRRALDALGRPDGQVEVVFSAHSLPQSILASGDPYVDELASTARLVAARAGLEHHRLAWQSAGRTGQAWLVPDLAQVLEEIAAEGARAVVVCPAGFTSDHLEILYDLDIEARRQAEALGLAFSRSESLNDDRRLFAALARRILELSQSDLV